jgi:hypothetical protein
MCARQGEAKTMGKIESDGENRWDPANFEVRHDTESQRNAYLSSTSAVRTDRAMSDDPTVKQG